MTSGASTGARCRTANVPGGDGGVPESDVGGVGAVGNVVGAVGVIAGAAIDEEDVGGGGGGGAIVEEDAVGGGGGGVAGAVLTIGGDVVIEGGVLVAVNGGPVKTGAALPDEAAVEIDAGIGVELPRIQWVPYPGGGALR